ncbi:unnamed protein product, partial [Phaeothamnion confervicola]
MLQRAMLARDAESGCISGGGLSSLERFSAAALSLDLLGATALFPAREPFRLALARAPALESLPPAARRRLVNTAWLAAPIAAAAAAATWCLRRRLLGVALQEGGDGGGDAHDLDAAAALVCVGAMIEAWVEPFALILLNRMRIGIRVRAEATGIAVLGLSRYVIVVHCGGGVRALGVSQLLCSLVIVGMQLLAVAAEVAGSAAKNAPAKSTARTSNAVSTGAGAAESKEGPEKVSALAHGMDHPAAAAAAAARTDRPFKSLGWWLPAPAPPLEDVGAVAAEKSAVPSLPNGGGRTGNGGGDGSGGVFHHVAAGEVRLAAAFFGQSAVKHVLTECDKLVLVGCASRQSGVYGIAHNYGSLVARLLLQPLEEAARLAFAKLHADETQPPPVCSEPAAENGALSDSAGAGVGAGGAVGGTVAGGDTAAATAGGGGVSVDRTDDAAAAAAAVSARRAEKALLATLLKLVLLLGLLFAAFGPAYTRLLMRLLLGRGRATAATTATNEDLATPFRPTAGAPALKGWWVPGGTASPAAAAASAAMASATAAAGA